MPKTSSEAGELVVTVKINELLLPGKHRRPRGIRTDIGRTIGFEPRGTKAWRKVRCRVFVETEGRYEAGDLDGAITVEFGELLGHGREFGHCLRRRRVASVHKQFLVVVEPVGVGQHGHRAALTFELRVVTNHSWDLVEVDAVTLHIIRQVAPRSSGAELANLVGRVRQHDVNGLARSDGLDGLFVILPLLNLHLDARVCRLKLIDGRLDSGRLAIGEEVPECNRPSQFRWCTRYCRRPCVGASTGAPGGDKCQSGCGRSNRQHSASSSDDAHFSRPPCWRCGAWECVLRVEQGW